MLPSTNLRLYFQTYIVSLNTPFFWSLVPGSYYKYWLIGLCTLLFNKLDTERNTWDRKMSCSTCILYSFSCHSVSKTDRSLSSSTWCRCSISSRRSQSRAILKWRFASGGVVARRITVTSLCRSHSLSRKLFSFIPSSCNIYIYIQIICSTFQNKSFRKVKGREKYGLFWLLSH